MEPRRADPDVLQLQGVHQRPVVSLQRTLTCTQTQRLVPWTQPGQNLRFCWTQLSSPVITQNSGGKEAPPPASPSYSVGRTHRGHESRFCWSGSFGSDQNLVGPSKAFSRTEKSSSSAEEPETSVKETSGINEHLGLRAVLTRPAGAADEQCRPARPQRHRTVPRVTDGEDGGLYVRLLRPENGPEEILLVFTKTGPQTRTLVCYQNRVRTSLFQNFFS